MKLIISLISVKMPNKYKRLIVSDLHLGSEHSCSDKFLALLKSIEVEEIILNGDIIDVLILNNKKLKSWPKEHSVVVQKLLRFIRHGGKIIWIRGNHEGNLLDSLIDEEIAGIRIYEEYFFGNVLIYHGDKLDFLVKGKFKYLSEIGAVGYEILLKANRVFKYLFNKLYPTFSLSRFIKQNVKKITHYVGAFEQFAINDAKLRGFNTVILGHIHQKNDKQIDNIRYMNSGCWMDDGECSYIVEHLDGTLELKIYE